MGLKEIAALFLVCSIEQNIYTKLIIFDIWLSPAYAENMSFSQNISYVLIKSTAAYNDKIDGNVVKK